MPRSKHARQNSRPMPSARLVTGFIQAAMNRYGSAFSRRPSRPRGERTPSIEREGAGNAECFSPHPRPRVQNKSKESTRVSPQVEPNHRHSLRNGFNGFLRALPGETVLGCHRRPRDTSRDLSTCIGAPGPHDFAVRVSIARLAIPSHPSHPAPNVTDVRETPLSSGTRRRES
jgi:hypothetical protein